jgi:hypothetical protein
VQFGVELDLERQFSAEQLSESQPVLELQLQPGTSHDHFSTVSIPLFPLFRGEQSKSFFFFSQCRDGNARFRFPEIIVIVIIATNKRISRRRSAQRSCAIDIRKE